MTPAELEAVASRLAEALGVPELQRRAEQAEAELARMTRYLGPCPSCHGSGLGEGEPVECGTAMMPTSCDACGGRGCRAAVDAEECRDGYYALVLGAKEGERAWEAAIAVRERANQAEADLAALRAAVLAYEAALTLRKGGARTDEALHELLRRARGGT